MFHVSQRKKIYQIFKTPNICIDLKILYWLGLVEQQSNPCLINLNNRKQNFGHSDDKLETLPGQVYATVAAQDSFLHLCCYTFYFAHSSKCANRPFF